MGEQDAAVFVFRVLVQIFVLPGEKIRQCQAEESDRARIEILLAWIDDDCFAGGERLDVLDEEIEAEEEGTAGWFIEEVAVETGKTPYPSRDRCRKPSIRPEWCGPSAVYSQVLDEWSTNASRQ